MMFVWRRAMLYLIRKKERTILLFLYMVVMASFILVAFSLGSAAQQELIRLQQTLGTGFVLRINTENAANVTVMIDEDGRPNSTYIGTKITDETINKILGLDGVTDYTMPREFNLAWTELKLRPGSWAEFEANEADDVISEEYVELARQTILAYSCTDGELSKNFHTGALEIAEGRNLQKDDRFRTVISEELAERNGLSVGDSITIEVKEGSYRNSKNMRATWGKPIELEIVGIFHMNFTQQYSEFAGEDSYMENNIYVDKHTDTIIDEIILDNWEGEYIDIGYTEVIFFVDHPEKTDSIIQEMKEREDIDIEGLFVYPDQTAYEASAKPYSRIRMFSTILSVIGIGGAGIILFLLMKLSVRGRMHEVGVLFSLGIKKRKIIGQMLVECLTVSVAALALAILLSGPLTAFCARTAEQLNTPDQKQETYRATLRSGIYPEIEKVSYEQVILSDEVTIRIVVQLIVLVSGISAVSVFLAAVQVLELEPKKLLQSM